MHPEMPAISYGAERDRLALKVRSLHQHLLATVQEVSARAEYERVAHQLVALEGGDVDTTLAAVEADPDRAHHRIRMLALGLTPAQADAALGAGLGPEAVQFAITSGIRPGASLRLAALSFGARKAARRERKRRQKRKAR